MDKIFESLFADEIKFKDNHKNRQIKLFDISTFFKQVPIFSSLDQTVLNHMYRLGTQKAYSKNSTIVSENEKGTALYLVIEGKLKVFRANDSGKEIILTILNKYDFFGEMSILDKTENSANVVAIEDSNLFIIQQDVFLKLLNEHHIIALTLMKELVRRIRAADIKIKSLSINNAEGKVAAVILELAREIGKTDQPDIVIEKIPHQHDFANMAGTSRETVSRSLHDLAKRGLIKLNGSKLTILDYIQFRNLYE